MSEQQLVQVPRRPRDCCNEPENMQHQVLSPGSHVEHCKVCGAKHYIMNAVKLGGSEAPPKAEA